MSLPLSRSLFGVMWLWGLGASAQPRPPDCLASASHVQPSTQPGDAPPLLCIRPGVGTSLLFDAALLPRGVTVQERERFVDVAQGERSVLVMPPTGSQPGERFRMEVRYADGADPERVTLDLMVHPTLASGLVAVERPVPSGKDASREPDVREVRLQACERSLERARREEVPGPILEKLIAVGITRPPSQEGLLARYLRRMGAPPSDDDLLIVKARGYRLIPSQGDDSPTASVAVAMFLSNLGAEPWTPGDAVLMGSGQVPRALNPWPRGPIAPGASRWVVMETELPRDEVQGTFRLELGEASGRHPVVLEHVAFP